MKTNKLPFFVIFLGVVGMSLINLLPKSNYKSALVQKGRVKINVLIADSPQKRTLGLGGKDRLGENSGMLFIFDQAGFPGIWMKDMRFPIDIVWIKSNTIVDIAESVPVPKTDLDLHTYTPSSMAEQALELNSGFCKTNGLKIGDRLEIKITK